MNIKLKPLANVSYEKACDSPSCSNPAVYFCELHNRECFCVKCNAYMHSNCKSEPMVTPMILVENTMCLEIMLNPILEYMETHHIESEIPGITSEIQFYQSEVERLGNKVLK